MISYAFHPKKPVWSLMAKVKEPSPAKAHASLLTDGRDVGATDLLGATDVVL